MKGHYVRPPKGLSELERFMLHVRKMPSGCWEWTASCKGYGKTDHYGQVKFRGKMERVHRVSCILHGIEIPTEMFVLHKCGNSICVNPDHLHFGDHFDNCKDRKDQGREGNHKGEANGRAVATKEMVLKMRSLRAPFQKKSSEWPYSKLAKEFGVTYSIAEAIVNRRTWKDI